MRAVLAGRPGRDGNMLEVTVESRRLGRHERVELSTVNDGRALMASAFVVVNREGS